MAQELPIRPATDELNHAYAGSQVGHVLSLARVLRENDDARNQDFEQENIS